MNARGPVAASTGARGAPGWRTLLVFALLAPALVVAVGSPAVTLATVGGFALGKSVRVFPADRVRKAIWSARNLLANAPFGSATTDFNSFDERVE
jgi:hypothetical protein